MPSAPVVAAPAPAGRIRALDGLRGLAMLLVLLSHAWLVAPTTDLGSGPLRQLLQVGNEAVSLFLVVAGFLLVHGLLSEVDRTGGVAVGRALVRRVVRVAVPVYLVVAAALVADGTAPANDLDRAATRPSVVAVGTFTWNFYLQRKAVLARPDWGHLWYISVYVQGILLLVVLVALLAALCPERLRRPVLAGLSLVALALVTWWRWHLVGAEEILGTLLRFSTRVDGLLWGALLAATLPWWGRRKGWAAPALALGTLGILVLLLVPRDVTAYLGWAGILACLSSSAVVVGGWLGAPGPLGRMWSWRPLVALGRASLEVYVWHYPVFWFAARHTDGWTWPWRTLVAVLATTGLVLLTRRVVAPAVDRLLDRYVPSARAALFSATDVSAPEVSAGGAGSPEPVPSAPSRRSDQSDA